MILSDRTETIARLEEQLNSFDARVRSDALGVLLRLASRGEIALPAPKPEVNLHFHTFFSYNAHGWSPSRVAWEARKYGLEAAGKVDFDVLDGMEEFLEAAELLGLKAVAGLETRVFVKEYAAKVINSPGEPGIAYFMAAGCYRRPDEASEGEARITLLSLAATARKRNEELMSRVNAYLDPVKLDYANDVLPLTPSGNATERHLLAAYDRRAREVFPDEAALAGFWGEKLGASPEQALALARDAVKLQEQIRSKLMKSGGVAYVKPDSGSFPTLESVIGMAKAIGAIPCATWLDGTNAGEEDMDEMFALLVSKGVAAANVIPDRNWNIADPDQKALKLKRLDEMVQAARKHHLPLCVGTEMNKLGLPFVDSFSAPELQPYVKDFIDGAHFFWGHTMLSLAADYGYNSPQVEDAFGKARVRKNKFFTLVGRLPMLPREKLAEIRELDMGPEHLYAWLRKAAEG